MACIKDYTDVSYGHHGGSVKLISTKLVNHTSLEQCHHIPMGRYCGGLL